MFTYRQNSRVMQEYGVGEHDGDVRFMTGSRNKAILRMRNGKYAIGHIYGRIAKIPASYRKSGSANTMATSDFWSKVEIWPFRACAMKKICNLAQTEDVII